MTYSRARRGMSGSRRDSGNTTPLEDDLLGLFIDVSCPTIVSVVSHIILLCIFHSGSKWLPTCSLKSECVRLSPSPVSGRKTIRIHKTTTTTTTTVLMLLLACVTARCQRAELGWPGGRNGRVSGSVSGTILVNKEEGFFLLFSFFFFFGSY